MDNQINKRTNKQKKHIRGWYRVFHLIVWTVAHLFFRFEYIGRDNVPDGAAILCANHSSNWDILFLTSALGPRKPLRFTPKTSLKKVPVLGQVMHLIGVIWVDRSKPADAGPVRAMLESLKNGQKVVLFPEGRRIKSDESEDAKTGAILLAGKSGAPIIPVHIPRDKRYFRKQTIIFGTAYTLDKSIRGAEARRKHADDLMERINNSENLTYTAGT